MVIKNINIMNTKEKLIQLLELCIKNNINFDYSTTETISISKLNKSQDGFKVYARRNITDSNLDELITKVKNYQP